MEDSPRGSKKYRVENICFGMDRATDESSLRMFLQRFTEDAVLDILIPRLDDEELTEIVENLNRILHRHLNKKEYHYLFLNEKG